MMTHMWHYAGDAWGVVAQVADPVAERARSRRRVTGLSQISGFRAEFPGSGEAFRRVVDWSGVGWSPAWLRAVPADLRWLPRASWFMRGDNLVVAVRSSGRRRRWYHVVVCEFCGELFLASRADACYCSPVCRQASLRAGYRVRM